MKAAKMFFLVAYLLPIALVAQSVEVSKNPMRIEGEETTGYQVSLDAPEPEVRQSLAKYLKALGRTKQSGDYITIPEPLIGGEKQTAPLFAIVRSEGKGSIAWLGTASGEGEGMKKLAYDFGVTFQRERIQLQIDESLRAAEAVEKQQSRLASQNKDLNTRIQNNKREKIQLENAIVRNEAELVDLTKKVEANAHATDSLSTALDQIKKVIEMHRERQRQVK